MVQHRLFLVSVWLGLLHRPAESDVTRCARQVNQTAPCLVQGERYDFDKLLYDGSLEKRAIPMIRRDEYFRFPPKDGPAKWNLITWVGVTSRMVPEAQGSVTLIEGGVGHETITLHVESKRGVGYNFQVLVYGVEAEEHDTPAVRAGQSLVSSAQI